MLLYSRIKSTGCAAEATGHRLVVQPHPLPNPGIFNLVRASSRSLNNFKKDKKTVLEVPWNGGQHFGLRCRNYVVSRRWRIIFFCLLAT